MSGRLHNGKLPTYRPKLARKGHTAFFWAFKTFGAAPILFSKDVLAACESLYRASKFQTTGLQIPKKINRQNGKSPGKNFLALGVLIFDFFSPIPWSKKNQN
ncbi:MAG TPA: hypothetical protein VGP21_03455 [Opitutaceae bacterium]|nr:hypothetical protein [Opitutaceae bacterium]